MPRRGRTVRHRSAVGLTALLVAVPTAVATASPGSHLAGDGASTGRQVAAGPAAAGLAWRTELEVRLENQPNGSFLSSNGLAIVQGRAVSDVPSTPQDEADTPRGALYGIDPTDGSVAWGGPAMDVNWDCAGVATSDDRLIVQSRPRTPLHPSSDWSLVALDATTGQRLPGQLYDGESQDADRLNDCDRRLVLTDDESLVLMASSSANGRTIRAIDIDSWTQAWEIDLRDLDGTDNVPTRNTPFLSADGDGVYAIYRYDRTGSVSEQVYRLERFDLADGSSQGSVDLPGSQQYVSNSASLAVPGGVVLGTGYCPGAPASAATEECVVRYDDDGNGNFSHAWTTYGSSRGGNQFLRSVAQLDADTVGGFAEVDTGGGNGLVGIDVDTGAIEWTTATPFSNNGDQFVTDPDGNGYFGGFGEYHLRSVSPDGEIRWEIDHCHLQQGLEPAIVGPIGHDGTLVTMTRDPDDDAKEILRGFRTGAALPKGDCPETEERLAGVNRIETAVDISQFSFEVAADTVVVATSTNYPDALAGGPLARRLDAPLLLSSPTALSPETRAEIERLGADRAVLLGGVGALSAAVESELDGMGLTVDRIAGVDRFETAQLISRQVPAQTVYVTEGANADPARGWPDAVAVSGLASYEQRPILLVRRDSAPAPTLAALDELDATQVVVVGGEGAVAGPTAASLDAPGRQVTREAGTSRYGTSVEIAKRSVAAGASTQDLWFATGLSFPDALAAGPAVARVGGVLLLVHGTRPDGGTEVHDWLGTLDDEDVLNATFVGGTGAISDEVARRLLDAADIEP